MAGQQIVLRSLLKKLNDEVLTTSYTMYKNVMYMDHMSYSWYMARFFNSEPHCWKILPA